MRSKNCLATSVGYDLIKKEKDGNWFGPYIFSIHLFASMGAEAAAAARGSWVGSSASQLSALWDHFMIPETRDKQETRNGQENLLSNFSSYTSCLRCDLLSNSFLSSLFCAFLSDSASDSLTYTRQIKRQLH